MVAVLPVVVAGHAAFLDVVDLIAAVIVVGYSPILPKVAAVLVVASFFLCCCRRDQSFQQLSFSFSLLDKPFQLFPVIFSSVSSTTDSSEGFLWNNFL